MPLLLGVYDNPAHVVDSIKRLRNRGFEDLETYTPAPFPEIDDALLDKPSPVRSFTLIGGLLGVVAGYALTIWMSYDWELPVGGKPFASIPPYTIIAFELTILFGGLLTVLGLFLMGGLPHGPFGVTEPGYSSRFSAEEFGVAVTCDERDVGEIEALMRANGAGDVTLVEA